MWQEWRVKRAETFTLNAVQAFQNIVRKRMERPNMFAVIASMHQTVRRRVLWTRDTYKYKYESGDIYVLNFYVNVTIAVAKPKCTIPCCMHAAVV